MLVETGPRLVKLARWEIWRAYNQHALRKTSRHPFVVARSLPSGELVRRSRGGLPSCLSFSYAVGTCALSIGCISIARWFVDSSSTARRLLAGFSSAVRRLILDYPPATRRLIEDCMQTQVEGVDYFPTADDERL